MNVQQVIVNAIKEQLFLHDYVVVPDFGGFVTKTHSSHFSGSNLLLPPAKTISFNVQLKQNDGILAFCLQEKLKCSADESLVHLKEFSAFCISVLKTKRRLSITNIGFFYLDFEDNLCFEPQVATNYLSSSFGLTSISLKELVVEKTSISKHPVFVDRKINSPDLQGLPAVKTNNFRKLLLPASFLLLFFGLLLLFVSNNRISGQLRASALGSYGVLRYEPLDYPSMSLFIPKPVPNVFVADANGIALLEFDRGKFIPVKAIDNTIKTIEDNHVVRVTAKDKLNRYEIVLGCFGVLNNAKRLASKLSAQKIDATISEKNTKGLYVVSSGIFVSKGDALAKLESLKIEFPGAWIKNP